MKETFQFGGNDIIAILTTIALLMPILTIVARRSMWHPSFAALIVYYAQFFVFNLFTNNYIHAGGNTMQLIQFSHIFIDLPLVLLFMQYFAKRDKTRSIIRGTLLAWATLAVLLITLMGLSLRITPYLMGPGLVMAAAISMGFFVKYLKSGIHNRWETGKAFMAGSLVFLYGCYLVIYVIQFVMRLRDDQEIYLLFQITTLISVVLMTAGLILNRKQPRKAPVDEKARDRNIILTNWGDFQFK